MTLRPYRISVSSILLTGLLALFAALNPQSVTAAEKSIVGSWVVDVFPNAPGPPPFKNLGTFTQDGGDINSSPSFGGGHGAWKKLGDKTYAVRFLTLVPPGFDPPFPEQTIVTVFSDPLTLNKDGDEMTGPFKTVFSHPITGAELASFEGTVVLTRIPVDQ